MRQLKLKDVTALRDRCTDPLQRAQWDAILDEMQPAIEPSSTRREQATKSRRDAQPDMSIMSMMLAVIALLSVVASVVYWVPKFFGFLLEGLLWLYTHASR